MICLGSAPGLGIQIVMAESSESSGNDSGVSNRLFEYSFTDCHWRDRDGFAHVQTAAGDRRRNEVIVEGQVAT